MKRIYIETYGCRLNLCDSEVILAIMKEVGYEYTSKLLEADLLILNSCSVRDIADQKIFERLEKLHSFKENKSSLIIGIVGCFAAKLNQEFLGQAKIVDFIANPNTYKELPKLVKKAENGLKTIHIDNNNNEIYHDIHPIRHFEDNTTAAIVIMKGCNQQCSYCIEPFTRGIEQSREPDSIIKEALLVSEEGYKEITLVGHVVDKYCWKYPSGKTIGFAEILEQVAKECPSVRIKFLSSHPLYFTKEIIEVIARNENIMRVIHLPVQTGSNKTLRKMHRGYSIEEFCNKISEIRSVIPNISIISDIIVGFCDEDEADIKKTEEILKTLKFDDINVFTYSMRVPSPASELYEDNIDEETKRRRLKAIIEIQKEIAKEKLQKKIGQTTEIIIEGYENSNPRIWYGRNRYHQTVVISSNQEVKINDLVNVIITNADHKKMYGEVISSK
jgi:tRNA-2-methylthio-N6-dimethylallyladenosine synthase